MLKIGKTFWLFQCECVLKTAKIATIKKKIEHYAPMPFYIFAMKSWQNKGMG